MKGEKTMVCIKKYVVGYREKKSKDKKWQVIGMPFNKKPTKSKLDKLGFSYMWSKGNEFKIQKICARK